jgi:hypothetical protein
MERFIERRGHGRINEFGCSISDPLVCGCLHPNTRFIPLRILPRTDLGSREINLKIAKSFGYPYNERQLSQERGYSPLKITASSPPSR